MESLAASGINPVGVEGVFHFTDLQDDHGQALRDFFQDAFDHDSLSDHTLLVLGFPAEGFEDTNIIDDDKATDREPIIPRHRKKLLFEESQALLVTMPGTPHEVAASWFTYFVTRKLEDINCEEECILSGAPTTKLIGVTKEPDASWQLHGKNYMTLVVEVGMSESERKLGGDAQIWLEHAEPHVTQVVTIKIFRGRPEMIFSVWKGTPQAKGTRSGHQTRAEKEQTVTVRLVDERPVADGIISLSFKDLLERAPRPGTAEKDLSFSTRDLGKIARLVWEFMHMI